MHKITETNEYGPLSAFYEKNGLEVEINAEAPQGTLKNWKYEDEESKEVLAAATLQKRKGCYVLGDLAVKEELRKTGLGKTLLKIAEEEAKSLGAEEMWLVGKVPEFYKQYGWAEVDRAIAPDISRCQSCDDFGVTCFPSIMKKYL